MNELRTLKIWGRANSANVKKVLWLCEEIGLPYERVDAGREHGLVDTPEYRKLNPTGLVPTIEDGDFVLWESNAIVRYLAAKHAAGTLWPTDLEVRADAERWMDWTSTTLWPPFRPVFWNLVRTPPEKRDGEVIAQGTMRAAEVLRGLDAALEGRDFVAGSRLTIGDIALGPIAHVLKEVPVELPVLPSFDAWYERISKRSAFQETVAIPLS